MKIIVTHLSPDFDAVTSCWLVKKFLPGWQNALIKFIPAGQTLNDQPPDINPNIIHVDTGLGKFDHHQTDKFTCATKLVFQFLKEKGLIKKKDLEPLEKLIALVNQIDHFQEVNFPNPTWDLYDLNLYSIIEGLKKTGQTDSDICSIIFVILDAVLINIKLKIKAEEEINKNGLIFQSFWGKSIAIKSANEETIKLALKKGFDFVLRYDPKIKKVRIKIQPNHKKNLFLLYQKLINIDPQATWFFHSSKKMILNGSTKNNLTKPTKIPFLKLIEIIKKI